jgi:hypothetical protein
LATTVLGHDCAWPLLVVPTWNSTWLLLASKRSMRSRILCSYLLRRRIGLTCLFFTFLLVVSRNGFSKHTRHVPQSTETLEQSFGSDVGSRSEGPDASFASGVITAHPISKLMADAEDAFQRKVERQSRTLEAAVAEYKRRYGRDPPKGIDHWWDFAQRHDVVMVDEFDAIVQDLAPFWEIPGEELRRRALQVRVSCQSFSDAELTAHWKIGSLPSFDLVRIFRGNATTVNKNNSMISQEARSFQYMLEKFQHTVRRLFHGLPRLLNLST